MNKEEQEDIFKSLVDNAFDFLSKAIEEIEDHPKYSVIHFHAAVELLIKARLMSEHWSLVIAPRTDPDWDKFVEGDFRSVSLKDAALRLKKIIKQPLTDDEFKAFDAVTSHRNKMVHFFHVDESSNNEKLKRKIVSEMLRAWYFLHKLLSTKWKSVFYGHFLQVQELHAQLKKIRSYLTIVYDQKKPDIEIEKAKGIVFFPCPSCEFDSFKKLKDQSIFESHRCMVCDLEDLTLKVECPRCDKPVIFENEGFGECLHCNADFTPDDLVDIFDDGASHVAALDGDFTPHPNCCECNNVHTVVTIKEGEYVCLGCFSISQRLECCEWCNESNTGDMQFSYHRGCSNCDGKGLD